jgi:hypothetical protein
MLNTSEMIAARDLFTKADAAQLNEIATMFNDARNALNNQMAQTFVKGQQVEWFGKRGHMSGKIVKVLRKNVRVQVESGDLWNVSASMLKSA